MLSAFAAIIVITMVVLAFVWSSEPGTFSVQVRTEAETNLKASDVAPGAFTTAALIGVSKTLLEKPGGYLRNDLIPPSLLLDNMPSWERGVVIELRDTIRALRDDFSRAQTQSPEDRDLVSADAQFHFDDAHWILPATEDEFSAGVAALSRYLARLHVRGPERANFHVRADNLNFYLATVEKRLGGYAQQLAGNVISWNAAGEPESDPQAASATQPTQPTTAWLDVDNVFYEARGYSWALLHTLRGIEKDFAKVMVAKAADAPLRQIIEKLEKTQATVWSPVILNNSGFGLLTNHSLVMSSYISRANAAIIDLRSLISEG
ncbi:MAG: hypothetical protein ACI9DC_005354 [Gammaproteobacteria bacterium]|jgi:hypothetical protein